METLNGHAYRPYEFRHSVCRPLLWRHAQPLVVGRLNIPNINNRDCYCAKLNGTEILNHHCSSHVSIAEPGAPYGVSDSSSSCSMPRPVQVSPLISSISRRSLAGSWILF